MNKAKQKAEKHKDTFYKDSTLYFTATIVSTGLTFLTLPIFTRYLSPSDYGIIALFTTFGFVVAGILSMGLQSASYRFYFELKHNINEYQNLNSSIILVLILVFSIFGLIIFYGSNWISSSLFSGKINDQLVFLSYISGCLEYLINYLIYLLTAQLRSKSYTILIIGRSLLKVSIALYFIIYYSLTYLAFIYAILITQLLITLILFIINKNLFSLSFSKKLLYKSFKFSYPNVLRLIIGFINTSFDKIMLTNFSGLSSVGYYSIAQKTAFSFKVFKDSIDKSWTPFFMNKGHENSSNSNIEIMERFYEIAFYYMAIGFTITCFCEEFIKLLTTKEFHFAMYVIPLFIFYYIVGIYASISIPQIQFSGKTMYILPATIVNVITNIVLNILLIPIFGIFGAVFSLIIGTSLGNAVHLYFGFKLFPIEIDKTKFLLIVLIPFIFTIPIYALMYTEINFLVKIIFKLIIFALFFKTCLKFGYLTKDKILFFKSKISLFKYLKFFKTTLI